VRSNDDAEPHLYEQVQCGPWEITKANLVLTSDKLGQGQFGQVRKGYIKNMRSHNVPVAVKSLKGVLMSLNIYLLIKQQVTVNKMFFGGANTLSNLSDCPQQTYLKMFTFVKFMYTCTTKSVISKYLFRHLKKTI
jgi:hypothetical protein